MILPSSQMRVLRKALAILTRMILPLSQTFEDRGRTGCYYRRLREQSVRSEIFGSRHSKHLHLYLARSRARFDAVLCEVTFRRYSQCTLSVKN
ncbi:hypothetical protein C8Q70DRAFT_996768 [Cubamyces menziesii]|nr:hypothetical protein C8Q70DRAFT_996768 [Cubamyces menziesii]